MILDLTPFKNANSIMNYEDFMEKFKNNANQEIYSDLPNEKINFIKLNYQRTRRIEKSYFVNHEICTKIKKISQKQLWVIITEDWCGDSAQSVPYIKKFSECNPLIAVKIVLRDHDLEIMDLYLTNGTSRSIPTEVNYCSGAQDQRKPKN